MHVEAIPDAARAAAGSGSRFERPALGANVAHLPAAHSWREEIGRSLTDHPLDRRSFVIRLDSHPGHTIPLSGRRRCCARSALQVLVGYTGRITPAAGNAQ